jgi:hypothetical protein
MSNLTPLEFYLCPQPSTTVFTGLVNGTPASPYINIPFDTGVTGSFGNPLAGMTVLFGSTAGGSERGKRRLRSFPGGAAGTLVIDESDDVGPLIQNNDHITIKWDIRLWPKYPKFTQSGLNVTIKEDYDVAYSNQTLNWYPVAVPGPPGVGFIEAGQAQISFVGNQSYALAPGATLSSYLWTAYDSVEGTSSNAGTVASPVTFSWTSPGWHLVSLRVIDSNGNPHTGYTWAITIDPTDPAATVFIDFDSINDNIDFNQGGGEASFVVRGTDASKTQFPEECLVVNACRPGSAQTTATGCWPYRDNVLFVGYILSNSVRQNPDTGEVSFRIGTIDNIMRNLSMFPASLKDATTPTTWDTGKQLTVDRCASFLYKWRSTLDAMTSVIPSNDTRRIFRQDFGPTDLYSMVQNELVASILGKVVSTHQSVLYHVIDYNLQNTTERATATTRKTLHKGIWVNDAFIEERHDYQWPARQVKASGIYYNGQPTEDICPLFSEAPGDAMKSYGKEMNFDRLILSGQTDLNVRTGHLLAKFNQRYPTYRMSFLNDASFTVGPQDLFPTIFEATDNNRELALSVNLIPRRINRQYDHEGGFYRVDVEFEPESSGEPGVTVDIPCGPPEQKLTTTPGPPLAVGGPVALASATTGSSYYYAAGVGQAWTRRVSGLVDPDQLGFEDMIPDPWTTFKQGYNPDNVIMWGCGPGFLVRSTDSGKNWNDRTGFLDAPNWGAETGTIDAVTMLRLAADIFSEDRLYVLAGWQTGGEWRAAVAKTSDGFDYEWHNLTGSAQVRPLGMSVDRGNGGLLWVTTWHNIGTGTLYLEKLNTGDMSHAGRYNLGDVSASDIDNQVYYAHPFNRLGAVGEVFVYGRMNNPQELSGTVHIMVNTGAGVTGSYSVIERQWGSNICGSFGADTESNYYAVRNG